MLSTDPRWVQTERHFRNFLLTSNRSEETARSYIASLSLFWRWCAPYEATPYEADRQLIRSWCAARKDRGISSQRRHCEVAALRSFYTWLREIRDRDDDPMAGISVKRGKVLPTKPFTLEEIDAMLKACENERDRLWFLVLACTGIRISELARLTSDSLNYRDNTVIVVGKGSKQREIAIPSQVLGRIRAHLGMFYTGPLWISHFQKQALSGQQIRKLLYGIAASVGVKGAHPHRFRATFATEYLGQHADIHALQGVMGHESIETTAKYAEYTKLQRGMEQTRRLNLSARLTS